MATVDIPEKLLLDLKKLRSPQGYLYAGYPRYTGLFGRDSLISGWQLLDYDPDIAKYSLAALARTQGKVVDRTNNEEPGKITNEYYPKETVSQAWFEEYKSKYKWLKRGVPMYFSVDSTPLFLMLLERYYEKTKDIIFLDEIWNTALLAMKWILNYGMSDGFLRYSKIDEPLGLMSQSWKDGKGNVFEKMTGRIAVVEVQGYLYASLIATAKLAKERGDMETGEHLETIANQVKERFNDAFWMEKESYYSPAIDGQNKQGRAVTSNPGQLLFTGIIDKKHADSVVKRLFEKDMWTPYGIRVHSTLESDFDALSYQSGSIWPHDNWIIAQGLREMDYGEEYEMVKKAVFKAYGELGSMPEFYCVSKRGKMLPIDDAKKRPCDPQAWSVGAMISFLEG